MKLKTLLLITGLSYLIIFFSAIFANFFALESLKTDPLATIQQHHMTVRLGILAFMITVIFDVVVAWSLYEIYKQHRLTLLSVTFRMVHAVIMAVAISALPMALALGTSEDILRQVDLFNTIWLIGLFFFGIHLILLGRIIGRPGIIALFLTVAGVMYMVDTAAHFVLPNYSDYGAVFLALVAIPSIIGEMAFAIWMLVKAGKNVTDVAEL